MIREIRVILDANPSSGNHFEINIDAPAEFFTINEAFYFYNSPAPLEVGVSLGASAINLYNYFTSFFSPYSFISIIQNSDGASILVNSATVTSVNSEGIGYFTITHTDIAAEAETSIDNFNTDKIILSRSPYWVEIAPTALYDEAVMDLRIYRGDILADYPLLPNYTLSKLVIIAGQPKIVFDIHKIVNDFVKNTIPTFGGAGSFTTSTLDTVWIDADITAYYQGSPIGNAKRKYLALDGYGNHTELFNPQLQTRALSTITDHVIYSGNYPLYFITKDLLSVTVNGTVIPFTFSQDFNNQIIGYVNVAQYAGASTSFNASFNYSTLLPDGSRSIETHTFTVKDECRFTVMNCIFKNKFGVWQTIPFNKLSKKTQDFTSDDYNGMIGNFGQYSLKQHQKKTFNANGREKITVNTDFIKENYNLLFQELFLSEFIYLEENGVVFPVNLLKKSFEKKTKLVNNLIQYTMEFEYSYELMNQVI